MNIPLKQYSSLSLVSMWSVVCGVLSGWVLDVFKDVLQCRAASV